MNSQPDLEKTLSSWTPRRPSKRLHKCLFPVKPRRNAGMARFQWLAPGLSLAACALLLWLPNPSNRFDHTPGAASTNAAAVLALFAPAPVFQDYTADSVTFRNSIPRPTFESTNSGQSSSSMGSLPIGMTNFLIKP